MQSRWKKAAPGALALVLFVALLARSVSQLARHPALNWDLLPAMALALEWEEEDPAELHRRTYAAARAELAPEAFRALTSPGVRAARAEDATAFHEHLPFYRARVLYSLATQALFRLGVPLAEATWWVPLGCFVLCALLFLAWAARHLPFPLAALFALGLAHTPALLNQAHVSSADGLATLLTCLGAWAWLEGRPFPLAAGFLTLAVAARPDAILLVGFVAAALLVVLAREGRPTARVLAAWLGLSAALYLAVQRFAGGYGWWPLMQISFLEKAVHPAALPRAIDWEQYGAILARQLESLPGTGYTSTPAGEVTGSTLAFLYAALAGLGLALALARRRVAEHAEARALGRIAALLAALLATYLVRFFLFPQLWDRFLAPFYALVPLCLVAALSRVLRLRAPTA